MAIVTMVFEEEGKEPELRKLGIITFEDIMEELLSEEIKDEIEYSD